MKLGYYQVIIKKSAMRKFILLILFIFSGTLLFSQTNGFVAAYDSMHQRFQVYYAFGEWKAIDWNALNNQIRPKIVNAGTASDTNAFYLALREYVASVPDGHISVRGDGWEDHKAYARYQQIGGSYGFALIGLDDGSVVTRLVNPGSPSALAGMHYGAEILEINDMPVNEVLDTVSVLWAEANPATLECKKLNQCRFIGRVPIGKTMKIKFRNRDAFDPATATLTAVDDNNATFDQTSLLPVDPGPTVSYKILQPSGYGYLKLTSEGGDSATLAKIYTDFREAITVFNNAGTPGMILDMRVNTGGEDMLSAALSGFFSTDTILYEYQSYYNPGSGLFELYPLLLQHFNPQTLGPYTNPKYPNGALFTEPQGLYYSNPVMVLVGPRNISSGEGIPMSLQRLPNNKVVSFYGSNGSFGMIEWWSIHFLYPPPDDLYLRYPVGRSLDKNLKIQVDSDSTMLGGIVPDIRVPLNDTVIDQLYIDSIDVELNYAISELNSVLGIDEQNRSATGLILEEIFPNPLKSPATISYRLDAAAVVSLSVYDLTGKLVKTLVDHPQQAGRYTIKWNAENVKPGVYFFRIQSGKYSITRKCIVQ
ncbi:MAG: T9SS C-terminal target domain-containing protein [Porphyromonadaceae bacterium]|nr:MAG: T9SS C-terminal target domain-containing protein [Porphyromonadaceae bacterium]